MPTGSRLFRARIWAPAARSAFGRARSCLAASTGCADGLARQAPDPWHRPAGPIRRAIAAGVLAFLAGSAAASDICDTAPWSGPAAPLIAEIAPLRESFPGLFEALETDPPEICVSAELPMVRGVFDPAANRITLHADLPPGGRVLVLLHELRHVEQAGRGFCPDNRLTLDAAARTTLATEADAMAFAAAAADTLREAGRPDAWNFLAESWGPYSDIADAFAADRAAGQAPAFAAAFRQWFASSWRVETYWLTACMDYLDREDAGHLLRGTADLPDDHLDRLCRLPDGDAYDCAVPEDLSGTGAE